MSSSVPTAQAVDSTHPIPAAEATETKVARAQSTYTITATVDAARQASVVKALRLAFGEDANIFSVEKVQDATSRAARLFDASSMVDDAREIVEELRSEMEEWYESIPDNLKEGSKAAEVEEARDALESLASEMENLDFNVECPGMF